MAGLGRGEHCNAWAPPRVVCLRDQGYPELNKSIDCDPIGFKKKIQPNAKGQGGNLTNWLTEHTAETLVQHSESGCEQLASGMRVRFMLTLRPRQKRKAFAELYEDVCQELEESPSGYPLEERQWQVCPELLKNHGAGHQRAGA